jgi:molybdopterin-binding protein
MKLSARNQLKGKIVEVKKGATTTHVRIDVGGQIITASITNESADEPKGQNGLRHRQGDQRDGGGGLVFPQCPLLAQSGHSSVAARCPLLGEKRTLANRRSSTSIYECTS